MGFLVKVVLALAVVAAGVWGYMTFMMPTAPAPVQETAPVVQEPAPQTQQPTVDDGGISTSGTSDTALDADLQAFDSQVQSAQSASADVDGSFNDQPIQQTE